jgi:hypothetical protein
MIGYLIGLIAVVALVLSIICMTRCKTDKFGEGVERQLNNKLSCADQAGLMWGYYHTTGIDKLDGTCIGEYVNNERNANRISCASNSMTTPLIPTKKKHTRNDGYVAYHCKMTNNVPLVSDQWCTDTTNYNILNGKFANNNKSITVTGQCYGEAGLGWKPDNQTSCKYITNNKNLSFTALPVGSKKAWNGSVGSACKVNKK